MEHQPKNKTESHDRDPLTRDMVVAYMRTCPEDYTLLHEYTKRREAEVEQLDTPREGLELSLELAELLRDAGNKEGARELFEITLMQAEQDPHDEDIRLRCFQELEKLG